MSYYDGTTDTMHTKLTRLLMDNGASVTKLSIDKLIEFIAIRDQSIINRVISDAEKLKTQLDQDTDIIALRQRTKDPSHANE